MPKASSSSASAPARRVLKGPATYSHTHDYRADPSPYRVGRGEGGVLTCQPYKGELLPLWRFATLEQAEQSADAIHAKLEVYRDAGDFPGADLARKFLQMGYTRSMRYYNSPGGSKVKAAASKGTTGEPFTPTGDPSKLACAQAFKQKWRAVVDDDEVYRRMKTEWMRNEGKA